MIQHCGATAIEIPGYIISERPFGEIGKCEGKKWRREDGVMRISARVRVRKNSTSQQ